MSFGKLFTNFKHAGNKILQTGISNEDSKIVAYAKYFTNSIAMLMATIAIIYFFLYGFVLQHPDAVIFAMTFFLSIVCFFLNFKGFGRTASIYIMTLVSTLVILISLLGGFDNESHTILIFMALCSASILLSLRLAFAFNIILFIVYVMVRKYVDHYGPLQPLEVNPNREYWNFGSVIVCTFIASRIILNTVLKYITDLRKALDEVKNKNEKIETQKRKLEMFNTLAAHDLRTPTRHINSFVEMTRRKINQGAPKREIEIYLDYIANASFRINELIDSLSTLNSVNKNVEEKLSPTFLEDTVLKIKEQDIDPYYQNVGLTYNTLPKLLFRPTALYIIFQNLMVNAAKFNQNSRKEIGIHFEQDQSNIFIHVTDNGIGIDENFKDQVFEAFKKLHIHEEYAGSGLGLYIVSDILSHYNGKISFKKNEKDGSTFTVQFPLHLLCENEQATLEVGSIVKAS